jgi:hypothetical protein
MVFALRVQPFAGNPPFKQFRMKPKSGNKAMTLQFNRSLRLAALSFLLAGPAHAISYEVWVSDQTNSQGISRENPNGTHGGFLRVFDGEDLDSDDKPRHRALDTAWLWRNALANTGSHVVRIHGMTPSPNHNYLAVSFVASGHLGLVDARKRRAVALFRTTETKNGDLDGAGNAIAGSTKSGQQNHLSLWSPDGKYLLISNQNGKLLERVNLSWDKEGNITGAVFDAAASLDLVGGNGRIVTQPVSDKSFRIGSVSGIVADGQSPLTPAGEHKQNAQTRPNNAAVCSGIAGDNRTALITLAGGGLFVVDYTSTPMQIVAEYDNNTISAAGCGAAESGGFTWLNAGVFKANVASFALYRLPTEWPSAPEFNPPNSPAPEVIYQDQDHALTIPPSNVIQGNNRDAHGFGFTLNRTYLHQFDRVKNNVEVFHVGTGERNTYYLTTIDGQEPNGQNENDACATTPGASYDPTDPSKRNPSGIAVYNDPSPDLFDISPHGNRFYVALRGPNPLSITHAAAGSCPGLGIVELDATGGGKHGVLKRVIPLEWLDYSGKTNISDPHAAVVRIK